MTKVIVHGSNLKKRHIVYAYTQIKASNIRYIKIMNGTIFPIMTGIFPIMNSRFSHLLHIMMLVTYKHMILQHSTSERHQYDVNMTSMFHQKPGRFHVSVTRFIHEFPHILNFILFETQFRRRDPNGSNLKFHTVSICDLVFSHPSISFCHSQT